MRWLSLFSALSFVGCIPIGDPPRSQCEGGLIFPDRSDGTIYRGYTDCGDGVHCVQGPIFCDGGHTPYEPCCIDGGIHSCICDGGAACRFTACAGSQCVPAGQSCPDAGGQTFGVCCSQIGYGKLRTCACDDPGACPELFTCGGDLCATLDSGSGCPSP